MKKLYFILFACIIALGAKAATFTVSVSGFAYSPNTLTVTVGDMVVFTGISGTHPTAQVDATTYAANGTTTLSSGWGVKTSNFTVSISSPGTIYYVCQNHVGSGMKGTITVNSTGVKENTNILQGFSLFPNPAQSDIKVGFSLGTTTEVSVKLFNLLGQEISVLSPSAPFSQGNYNLSFALPLYINNGTYFVAITANEKTVIKKLIVTK
jgi:plastocyanin